MTASRQALLSFYGDDEPNPASPCCSTNSERSWNKLVHSQKIVDHAVSFPNPVVYERLSMAYPLLLSLDSSGGGRRYSVFLETARSSWRLQGVPGDCTPARSYWNPRPGFRATSSHPLGNGCRARNDSSRVDDGLLQLRRLTGIAGTRRQLRTSRLHQL